MPTTVRALDKQEIDQAFALARLAVPDLAQAAWRDFARGVLSGRGTEQGGILVAEQDGSALTGLLVYWLRTDLRRGRLMIVDALVPVGLSRRRAGEVTRALLDAAERTARRLGCAALRVTIEERRLVALDGERADVLGDLGFTPEMLTLYELRL